MAAALGQELRLFDLAEAERMLPLVRAIVKGMMDDDAERRALLERLAAAPPDPRAREVGAEVDALTEKLVEAADELAALGVEFKGIELGLVDFPARVAGEPAYLCWRYDEDGIRWWHPIDAGYAGRRPIEPD